MDALSQIQLGKNGLTESFLETLKSHFKSYKNVKVSVLKGAGPSREKVKEHKEEILKRLGVNYTARIVGFTIFIKKWRKARG